MSSRGSPRRYRPGASCRRGMSRAGLPRPGPGGPPPSSGARRRWGCYRGPGKAVATAAARFVLIQGEAVGRQVPPAGSIAGGGRQGSHLGGDPRLALSHGERISSDHRTPEGRVRLAAGGYGAAAPGEARSRARRLQELAPLRERAVVRRPDVRAVAGRPLSAPVDDGAAAARCDPRCDRRLADRGGRAPPRC